MGHLEVLMVTTKQSDYSVLEKSCIKSSAVLSNQSENLYNDAVFMDEFTWKIISTNTIGVGINRNIGLNHAKEDYCIFMDDDMICYDGYQEKILDYFKMLPEADILIFNVNTIGMDMGRKKNSSTKRVRYHNFMNYGAVRIAIKLSSIRRENIHFNTLFGGGCLYSSGEDTIFLKQCLDARLKIYAVPYCYADVFQHESSWYEGINEKYIYDKGALMKAMFKHIYPLLNIIFSFKLYNSAKLSFFSVLKLMMIGSKNYKSLITFSNYKGDI